MFAENYLIVLPLERSDEVPLLSSGLHPVTSPV